MNVFVLLGLAWAAFLAKFATGFLSRRSGPSLRGLVSLQRRHDDLPPLSNMGYPVNRSSMNRVAPYTARRSKARVAARRRRDVFVLLAGLALATLLPALLVGGSLITAAHVVIDVVLGLYVFALVQRRRTVEFRSGRGLAQPVRHRRDVYPENVRPLAAQRRPQRGYDRGFERGYERSYESRMPAIDFDGGDMVKTYPAMREHRTG